MAVNEKRFFTALFVFNFGIFNPFFDVKHSGRQAYQEPVWPKHSFFIYENVLKIKCFFIFFEKGFAFGDLSAKLKGVLLEKRIGRKNPLFTRVVA